MDARRFRAPRAVAALLCCLGLLSGCSHSSTSHSGEKEDSTARAARAAAPGRAVDDLQNGYLKVIEDVLPSVVQIQARTDLGSGVVYDGQGHIVTNAHVVGTEDSFRVTTANSEDTLTARLVFSYPQQDLAVIKLDKAPKGLKAARFGDSAKVEVGQIVLAMGSPLGLSSSVTQGIVSATGRTVTESRDNGGTGATIPNMVQTSAAINPGNSGGALVNLDGRVIGIPTLAATEPGAGHGAAPGIGFAIPASTVRTVADQIVKDGKVTETGRAALGITGRTVVNDDYEVAGVAVVEVTAGGAADKAGLEPGDVITRLGDTDITTITSLAQELASDRPGERTTVTYTRDGDEKTVDVTLGEQ
ncbi:S1C family serine protease [Streptomyces sp. NPDC007808]|uniref:S1C family serine protease n=1 Tax=Streptomyces sp. NPDC007808 TaxID=3364779 RepID=UPI003680B314